jgi:hypothetical protein
MHSTEQPNTSNKVRKAKDPQGLELRWHAQEAERRARDHWDQIKRPPDPAILHLYKYLRKAESIMLVQLRTGRTGLRHFLSKARVPGYESEQCSCGTGSETPRHILLHCSHKADRRIVLREALGGQLDLNCLLDTPRRAPVGSKWMILRLQQLNQRLVTSTTIAASNYTCPLSLPVRSLDLLTAEQRLRGLSIPPMTAASDHICL